MKYILIIIDLAAVLLSLVVAYFWRQNFPFNLFLQRTQPFEFYLNFLPTIVVLLLSLFYFAGLYKREAFGFDLFQRANFIKAMFFLGISFVSINYLIKYDYSRLIFLIFWLVLFIFIYAARWQVAEMIGVRRSKVLSVLNSREKGRVLAKELATEYIKKNKLDGMGNDFKGYEIFKRLLDIVFAFLMFVVTLPFWPIIILLIKFESGGNEIFKQKRVGQQGRPIYIYKFKTMKGLPNSKPAPRSPDDDRVTKIGRILRKYSLDELPQVINVLKGEMSLVGPRPEMPFIVKKYNKWQKVRLLAKPGLTGLWQVLGRKDLPLEENLEYDFYYLNNQSLFLDLAIILKTVPMVIRGYGAY